MTNSALSEERELRRLIFLNSISNLLRCPRFKALVNEDTLLPTHCCSWCFLGYANWETFVADTKCFWTKSETFFVSRTQNLCPQQMLRARTGKRGNICVGNNVSATLCPRLPGPFLRPSSDAVHMSRIECNWGKSFVLLMWSKASELGLISFQFIFSFESNLHRFVHPKHLSRVE